MGDCYLEQAITENTRGRGPNIPSLIDLVLCYDREQISNIKYLGPLSKSDQCVVTLLYNITFENCSYRLSVIFMTRKTIQLLKNIYVKTNNIEWDIILSGKTVQQQWDILVDIIGSLEEQYIPSKMVEIIRMTSLGKNFQIIYDYKFLKNTTCGSATWKPGDQIYIAHCVGLETRLKVLGNKKKQILAVT